MKLLHEMQTVIRLAYRKSLDFPPHVHNAVELVFCLRGTSTAVCGAQRWALNSGDVFIAFPNQVHGYENTEDFRGVMLIIPTKPCLSAYRTVLEQKQPVSPVLHLPEPEGSQLLTILQLALEDRETAPQPMMQGYCLVILSKLLPLIELTQVPTGTDALQTVLRYIGEHYTQPISRAEIARAVGYSESYISHIFSDYLNTTLVDYITMLRMDDARQLLADTDLPVSRIAMQLGFASIRSFNRFFAKEMKMTPTAYRALRR